MPVTNDPEEWRKWKFLESVPKRDAMDLELRALAECFRTIARASAFPDWTFTCLCLALARDGIKYQTDTERVGREQIDGYTDPYVSPLEPYRRGFDDCDAKARFFVALCLAGGIEAEMVARWRQGKLAHVYGRAWVKAPGQAMPQWQIAETILNRARLGEIAEQVPKEPDTGKWSM